MLKESHVRRAYSTGFTHSRKHALSAKGANLLLQLNPHNLGRMLQVLSPAGDFCETPSTLMGQVGMGVTRATRLAIPNYTHTPLDSGFRRNDGAMHRTGSPRMPCTPIRESQLEKGEREYWHYNLNPPVWLGNPRVSVGE